MIDTPDESRQTMWWSRARALTATVLTWSPPISETMFKRGSVSLAALDCSLALALHLGWISPSWSGIARGLNGSSGVVVGLWTARVIKRGRAASLDQD